MVEKSKCNYKKCSGRTHHELLLIKVGGVPQDIHRSPTHGFYHIGFKIGNTDDELRAAIIELESSGVQIMGV